MCMFSSWLKGKGVPQLRHWYRLIPGSSPKFWRKWTKRIVDRPSFLAFIASVRVIMVEAFTRLQGTEALKHWSGHSNCHLKCQEIWVSCRRQRGSRWCCLYDSFRNYLTHAAWPANAKPRWSNVCSKHHHRNVTKHKPMIHTSSSNMWSGMSNSTLHLTFAAATYVLSLVIQNFLLVLWQPSELTVSSEG